ncbi:MAG: hypothetical protein QM831_38255 [Kofleriaceae bacterium]
MKFKVNQRLPSGSDVTTPEVAVAAERVRPGRFLTAEQQQERDAARERFRASLVHKGSIE